MRTPVLLILAAISTAAAPAIALEKEPQLQAPVCAPLMGKRVDVAALKAVLATGADPQGRCFIEIRALFSHPAAFIKMLFMTPIGAIIHEAAVNKEVYYQWVTPLHLAVVHRHRRAAEILVAAGADIDAQDELGLGPLDLALYDFGQQRTNGPIIRLLLAHGADVGKVRVEATVMAGAFGSRSMRATLREAGVPIDYRDCRGRTMLQETIDRIGEDRRLFNWLLDNGADPDNRDNIGRRPLHEAAAKPSTHELSHLLAVGAMVEVADDSGYTPLHEAIKENHPAARLKNAKLLVEAGADVNASASKPFGETPAHQAIQWNQPKILEYLLSKGAELPPDAIRTAAQFGANKSLRYLVHILDVPIDAKTADGLTAYCDAVKWKNKQASRLLQRMGASTKCPDPPPPEDPPLRFPTAAEREARRREAERAYIRELSERNRR